MLFSSIALMLQQRFAKEYLLGHIKQSTLFRVFISESQPDYFLDYRWLYVHL